MNLITNGEGRGQPLKWLAVPVRLLDSLTRFGLYVSSALMLSVAALVSTEVGLRYFFNAPSHWIYDTVNYLFCAIIFLAVPELTRMKGHIAITVVLETVGPETSRRLQAVITLIAAAVCGVASYMAGVEASKQFMRGILTLGTFAVPKWWITAFIVYGLALSSLQFLKLFLMPQQTLESDGA